MHVLEVQSTKQEQQSAVIQEGLRLSYGVSTRLQRISPDKVMTFNDGKREWQIPPGVRCSGLSSLNSL